MHYSSYVSAWSSIDVVALSNIWWVWLLMGVAGDLNGCGKCSYSCTFDSSFDGFLSLFAHHAPPPSTPWLYMEWQRTQLCMQRILPSISLKEAVSCGTMWMGGVEVVVSRRRLLPSFLFHCVLLIYVKKSTLETNVCKPFSVVLKAIKMRAHWIYFSCYGTQLMVVCGQILYDWVGPDEVCWQYFERKSGVESWEHMLA